MPGTVEIIGLTGLPLVKPGNDIAELVFNRARSLGVRFADGDIVVIGHKILSKSEGRIIELSKVKPSTRAVNIARRSSKDPRLVQLIINEARRIIKVRRGIILTEARQGIVCLNAGIDKSNVQGDDTYCLLPVNPNLTAQRIAKRISHLAGKRVRVVVTDTHSRPFRVGQSEFAIGTSRLDPFFDYRGRKDLFGHILKFKRVSIADELACAAELVMGQGAEGIPVAIIRGVRRIRDAGKRRASRLEMKRDRDLFRSSL
jgi:coenzyme F420-0:L-glutamate ligase/coenzyme F420-1:gamma-L-glutamate ligase